MVISEEIQVLATQVLDRYTAKGWMLATAESCTGGLIAAALTDIAGSSSVVERGFVTYTNTAKNQMLGVPEEILENPGAVSEKTARAMAQGALLRAPVNVAVSVTGIAGPGGGTDLKPVGLVHFGLAQQDRESHTEHHIFPGDRVAVRVATVRRALQLLAGAAD